jgi:hypothetical protein
MCVGERDKVVRPTTKKSKVKKSKKEKKRELLLELGDKPGIRLQPSFLTPPL